MKHVVYVPYELLHNGEKNVSRKAASKRQASDICLNSIPGVSILKRHVNRRFKKRKQNALNMFRE